MRALVTGKRAFMVPVDMFLTEMTLSKVVGRVLMEKIVRFRSQCQAGRGLRDQWLTATMA